MMARRGALEHSIESLIAAAQRAATIESFLPTLGDLLSARPLAVERVFLSVQTIHPAFRARTYHWLRQTTRAEVVEWPHGLRNRPGYYRSPDNHVHATGTEFRVKDLQHFGTHPCDLYGQLRDQGYTDYLIVPLPFSDGTVNALSIATKRAGGFPARSLDWFRRLIPLFVVVFERYAALETRGATLEAYLGRSAAREVLKGRIRSGHGEEIEAAILFADLHDFTRHAANLDPADTVRLLNEFFDCLVGPIEQNGGYVLKFIGDAVLAFFPILDQGEDPAPVKAIFSIRQRLAQLNESRESRRVPLLRQALCVHFGRALYGNIGSSERLDFTIIGEAVNIAARGVEAAKALNVEYVLTGDFAERFGYSGLVSAGRQTLRGISEPLELFTLVENGATEVGGGMETARRR
jgi:adenylate cyclase